jgi:hypothetical protein
MGSHAGTVVRRCTLPSLSALPERFGPKALHLAVPSPPALAPSVGVDRLGACADGLSPVSGVLADVASPFA